MDESYYYAEIIFPKRISKSPALVDLLLKIGKILLLNNGL